MRNDEKLLWLALSTVLAACSPEVVEFKSPSPLAEGMRGKVWADSFYLDPNPTNPSVNASSSTVAGFDFVGAGDSAMLAASFYDSTTAKFIGYARRYSESSGWNSAGPDFTVVASSTNSLGHTAITASPGGSAFLATFFEAASAEARTAARYTYWLPQQTMTAASSAAPSYATASSTAYGPAITTSFDAVGKAYTFYHADALASAHVTYQVWEPASGMSSSSQQQVLSAYTATPTTNYRRVRSVFDGKQKVCVFAEDASYTAATRRIYVRCLDTAGSTLATPSFTPTISAVPTALSDADTAGFDAAADGEGNIVAVFYQVMSGKWHLGSSVCRNGVWDKVPTQVSGAVGNGFQALPSAVSGDLQISPGIAHIGSGNFVAVWTSINTSTKKSGLYYAVYDKAKGWLEAKSFGGTSDYTTTPPYGALHVFSNGKDQAGVAVNYTSDEAGRHKVLVSRFQTVEGWETPVLKGNGCIPAANTTSYCTGRPAGAVLTSGLAVVVYQDQDASGRFRLAGMEYK